MNKIAVSNLRELLSFKSQRGKSDVRLHACLRWCALQTALAQPEGLVPFHMKLPYDLTITLFREAMMVT
jgi:hypothetical protein